jgi:amidase
MIRIARDQLTYQFSADLTPVATVMPGDLVVFETYDTSSGRLTCLDDLPEFLRTRDPKRVNPAAGPVYVDGAEPGDELIVEIVNIQLAHQGWVRVVQGAGVLQSAIDRRGISLVQVDGNELVFDGRLRLPARPMIGVIGTASASGVVYTAEPGPLGSNIDVNAISVGARVHLPVHVPGALLAIGDIHATMGDGEASGTGVEINADVTARIGVSKGTAPSRIWIETKDAWISSGHGHSLEMAIEIAVEELCAILMAKLELTRTESFLLISARGDIRIGQCARIPGLDATAYAMFPKFCT